MVRARGSFGSGLLETLIPRHTGDLIQQIRGGPYYFGILWSFSTLAFILRHTGVIQGGGLITWVTLSGSRGPTRLRTSTGRILNASGDANDKPNGGLGLDVWASDDWEDGCVMALAYDL